MRPSELGNRTSACFEDHFKFKPSHQLDWLDSDSSGDVRISWPRLQISEQPKELEKFHNATRVLDRFESLGRRLSCAFVSSRSSLGTDLERCKQLMRKISALVFALVLIIAGYVNPSSANDDAKGSLSPYGQQAVVDLASCLRTADSLDVYYLIDNSTSLKESDPSNQRSKIILQDIKRWGDIAARQSGLSVRIAGSFFNSTTRSISGWQDLTKDNASSVGKSFTSTINNSNLGDYTNWLAALEVANNELSSSPASCKAVIWFTDGGLWMPGTSSTDRSKSLDAVAELCGGGSRGSLASSPSSKGIVAQMRTAGIHLFGILLNKGKDKEKDEAYYRSLMQPIIEETGSVSSQGNLPGGTLVCGENVPSNERAYAAGAFLQATSAADVAYSFMTIPSVVSGGSQAPLVCVGSGEFYVDPGIDSFEISTDAKSWAITDAKGAVVAKSPANFSSDGSITTGRIAVPKLKEAEKWKFSPMGGLGKCQLFVYPELELILHSKALVAGKKSSVTGQFVKSSISGEKADLTVFKKVDFKAFVNKRDYSAAQLDPKTGSFTIRDYTPTDTDVKNQVLFGATLKLATEHYDLYPINFEQSEQVFDAAALPQIGEIKFSKGIKSAKDFAVAEVTVAPPATPGLASSVCFNGYDVIADKQDESAGKATDRHKSWKWSVEGLDANGCIDVLMGTNKAQVVRFKVSNEKQADSTVSALFDYRISAGDLTGIKDSQTASFVTETKTSAPLFWLVFGLLLLLGLAIPFGILTWINFLNSRLLITPDDQVAEFDVEFKLDERSIALFSNRPEQVRNESGRVEVLASGPHIASDFRDIFQGEIGKTCDLAGSGRVTITTKPSLWPLNGPKFFARVGQAGVYLLSRARPDQVLTGRALPSGRIGDLSYVHIDELTNTGKSIKGQAVVHISQTPSRDLENYQAAVHSVVSNESLKDALKAAIESLPVTQPLDQPNPHWGLDDDSGTSFDFEFDSNTNKFGGQVSSGGTKPNEDSPDFDFKF